jgi:hypothetical protein
MAKMQARIVRLLIKRMRPLFVSIREMTTLNPQLSVRMADEFMERARWGERCTSGHSCPAQAKVWRALAEYCLRNVTDEQAKEARLAAWR